MSSFFIFSMEAKARLEPGDEASRMSSGIMAGATCHETPYLSLSQPHCCALGSPPAPSFS